MRRQRHTFHMDEQGASALEFALVLPLLLTLVVGSIEFGILLYDKAMITNASREGARAGITMRSPRMSTAQISSVVADYCANFLVTFDPSHPPPTTRVLVNDAEADPSTVGLTPAQDYLTVEVSYNYTFLLVPGFFEDIGMVKTLQATTTMRAE